MNNLLIKNVLVADGSESPLCKRQVFIEDGVFTAFDHDTEACILVK